MMFKSTRPATASSNPQQNQSSEGQDVPMKGLRIETVKTQGLTVGPNSWTEDGAGWLNKEALEPVAFDHVNDPLQQPQGGKIIVT